MKPSLSSKKTAALERMRLSQENMQSAMFKGAARSGLNSSAGGIALLLSWLAPEILKQINRLVQGEGIAKTLQAWLNTAEQQFKKTLGPAIDQHPFVSVLIAASAGALLVRYRRVIADFLAAQRVP
jgi:hypothetical protein